jgi:hypothetical protein
MFRKKTVPFHPAGGASGQLSRQTPGLGTNRVTPVNNTRYGVTDPTGDSASDRAEEIIFFHKNFVKKDQKYHAAAGESGFWLVNRPK